MKPRVLVIEDNPRVADLLRRGLELQGNEVVLAADGPSGRERWAEGGFGAIVLDVMLPGINGIDLCAERRETGDRTPVILLTARDDDRARERGTAAGANAFVLKPFSYAELVGLVARFTGVLDAPTMEEPG